MSGMRRCGPAAAATPRSADQAPLQQPAEWLSTCNRRYASGGGFVSADTAAEICAAGPKLDA